MPYTFFYVSPPQGQGTLDVPMLYHYTSLKACVDILRTCRYPHRKDGFLTLWATQSCFLNDPNDSEVLPHILQRDWNISAKDLELIYKTLGVPFVLSLSKSRDSLTLWRLYADNAKGIALGIDENCFMWDSIKYLLSSHRTCIDPIECEYVLEDEMSAILSSNPDLIRYLEGLKDGEEFGIINNTNLQNLLIQTRMKYKSIGYKDEHEVRIACYSQPSFERMYLRGNQIVFYHDIYIPIAALKEIWIGPCADSESLRMSFQVLLNDLMGSSGNSIRILKSCNSYR